MRVLITGSSGRVGAAVAGRLAQFARVVGLDRRPGPHTTHVGDVTDHGLAADAVRGADVVVHVAALHVPDLATATEAEFRRVNVDATRHLLEAASGSGVGRFVLLSTTSVYGCSSRAGPPATWADELLPPRPEDAYDRTKLEAEELCRSAAGAGMTTVILRLGRCFPEPEPLIAFYRLYRGVDLRDVAEVHALAATVPLQGTVTVNVAGPTPFERGDVEELWTDPWGVIERRCPGLRDAFVQRGWPIATRIDRVYPIDEAKATLGYRPRFGVRELLAGGGPKGW